MKRSKNATVIYKSLYMNPNENVVEDVHKRVASCIGNDEDQVRLFEQVLNDDVFRPNTPCLINARPLTESQNVEVHDNNLVACFVLPLEDSMESIMELWSTCAKIYAGGGGAGFCITNLREKESPITAGGVASGPIEYLKVVQTISNTVKSGGKARRAANLASMWYKHPDILDLITCKTKHDFSAVNISVLVDDEFMNDVYNNNFSKVIDLVSPNKNKVVGNITVKQLWDLIIDNAYLNGDPGLLFKTTANKFNPLPSYGEMTSSNPCLPSWAPVLTPDGYKHFININNQIVIDGDIKSCSNLIETAKDQTIFEVVLQNGMSVYATNNHLISTENGDIELQNLKFMDKVKVDYTPCNTTKYNMNLEDVTDYNIGYVIGLLYAEGTIYTDSNHNRLNIAFSLGYKEFGLKDSCEKLINSVLKTTTFKFTPHFQSPDTCLVMRINKKQDIQQLLSLMNCNSKDDFDLISKPLEFQIGFVDAMITHDGHVLNTKKAKQINLNQSGYRGYRILKQIQLVIASRGVYSNLTLCNNSKINSRGINYKESWRLEISDVKSFINSFTIYNAEKSERMIDSVQNYGIYKDVRISTLKKFQKIKEINQLGNEDVFDINVPNGNHFVTSGVVVHNCGEVLLPCNSCCDLGSINLNKCILNGEFDYKLLAKYSEIATDFLDNVIDKTSFPTKGFEEMMKKTRPIGIGLMGFADILYKLKIRYGSTESIQLFENICKTITQYAFRRSIHNAREFGNIDIPDSDLENFIKYLRNYGLDTHDIEQFRKNGIRNSNVTSIAPTGSISISADCSYAFEPMMAIVWEKKLVDRNATLQFINQDFINACEEKGIELTDILKKQIIENKGSIQSLDFPKSIKDVFVTAHDISPEQKIMIQSIGQKYITLAISSTCNLPYSATKEDISNIYKLAWKNGLKGITVYRDGSYKDQPVSFGKSCVMVEPMILPSKRPGSTVKIKGPNGTMYITGNKVDDKLVEVFLAMGKAGQVETLLIDTLSKIISKSLQYHMPTSVILDQMEGEGGRRFWFKLDEDRDITTSAESIVDGIAKVVKYHFLEEDVDGHNINSEVKSCQTEFMDKCPECGKMTLQRNTGCRGGMCTSCGYAACG